MVLSETDRETIGAETNRKSRSPASLVYFFYFSEEFES